MNWDTTLEFPLLSPDPQKQAWKPSAFGNKLSPHAVLPVAVKASCVEVTAVGHSRDSRF